MREQFVIDCQRSFHDCFSCLLFCFVIGLIIRVIFSSNQRNAIVTSSRTFSRAQRRLRVFALHYDWLVCLPKSVVIGQFEECDCPFCTK